MTGVTCLDEETLLGLVEGRLGAAQLASVDDHLDGCDSCREVVTQLARSRAPHEPAVARGQAIGRYVVGELLGSGAMGHVYSAWQPELDRRVALKVLRDRDSEHVLREARAMARLDHPNVVGVHEVGTTDDAVFVVMDLVAGETLRTWARTPRPWRERVRVLVDVARGLAAVHAAGVVHRDVKPDNIIVGLDDGRARLGDFGLARSHGGEPRSADPPVAATALGSLRTATAVAGTPLYMAPEVLAGGAATAVSDQFSFGVTAYELLAGARPFRGDSWRELRDATAAGELAPLRGVPAWLDAAVRRCLATDPARRFASLDAFADHVARGLQRRRPGVWLAAIAAAAVVASGATWLAVRPRAEPASCGDDLAAVWNPAARARAAALGAPALAAIDRWTTAWTDERAAICAAGGPSLAIAARERCLDERRAELAALLSRAARPARTADSVATGDDLRPATSGDLAGRLVDALAALSPHDCARAPPGAAVPLPLDPDRAAAARQVELGLADVRAAVALGDARPVLAASAQLVTRAGASGHAPTLAAALLARSDALYAANQLGDAATAARDALAAAERGHDDLAAARAWLVRTTLATDRRELAIAEDFAAITTAAVDRAGAPPRLVAQAHRLRAQIAYNRGDLATARTELVAAQTALGERSADIAAALGSVERAAGNLAAALEHHRAALALDRAARGDHHPDVARDLHNVAGVLRLSGALDDATRTYREALAIEVATRGDGSVEASLTRNSLALVAMARNDWAGARALLEQALAGLTAANHGDRAFAEHNLGLVAAATGDHRAALAHYATAGAIYATTIGSSAPPATRLELDRARSQAALGRTGTRPRAAPQQPPVKDVGVYGAAQR